MSSSRPPDVDGAAPDSAGPPSSGARPRRPWKLRTTLVLSILALIVGVCALVGVVTEIFLSRYLVERVDQQVMAMHDGPSGDKTRQGASYYPSCNPDAVNGRNPWTQSGSLWLYIDNGQTQGDGAVPSGNAGGCTRLSAEVITDLANTRTDRVIRTEYVDGLGDYRIVASVTPNGVTEVTGLSLASVNAALVRLGIIMAAVTGAALLIGAGVVVLIVRRALRPLDRVAATAHKVSSTPLASGDVVLSVRVPERDTDPRTEVGQVGAALNQMLGHVSGALVARQESEMRVRQFVADASHELRTPLASIRGYAELARREGHRTGSPPAGAAPDEEDVTAHALRRVESESARMTTLVEDLLLLARLDSGRPLSRDEVDLTMLVLDAVSDAQVSGPDHRWQLDLPEEPVTAVGDPHRLHQVVANLLTNARTHTPAGTRVETGLRVDGAWAVITVTDSGPGIPADLQPEIFNRFVRGDSSRSRAAGSTGLGLAIVDAVTSAHGGSVDVRSRPGRTTFTVRLPRPAEEQPAATIRGTTGRAGSGTVVR